MHIPVRGFARRRADRACATLACRRCSGTPARMNVVSAVPVRSGAFIATQHGAQRTPVCTPVATRARSWHYPHAHPSTAPPRLGERLARPTHKLLDVFRLARVAARAGGLYSLRGGAKSVRERCAGRRATCFSWVMGHVQAAVGRTAQYTSSLEQRWSLGFACMSRSARYRAPISDHHACAVFGVRGRCPRPDS